MRICITRSEKYAYSETFIRNQIEGLAKYADVNTIHSGRYPEREENGTLLSPKLFWFLHKVIKVIVGRNNFFSNYGVKKYLKNNNIDLVWANYGISGAHMVPATKALNIPLITIFHGHDATDRNLLNAYRKKYIRLFEAASYIVVVSEDMKKGLAKLGANSEKIFVIPCGINTNLFQPPQQIINNKDFLAVGRLTLKKGPLHTIRAFHQVLQKHPDATLTMVGKKSGQYEKCINLVNELNIQDSVTFTGIKSQEEIALLMRSSLAYVQHSVTAPNGDMEGTPVSIMEAGASGMPIVSTRHGGIKEAVVHGTTGFLVDEMDEDGMAKYMIELCENPEMARNFGLNGRKHMEEHYNLDKQIKKYYDLMEHAVHSKNHVAQ